MSDADSDAEHIECMARHTLCTMRANGEAGRHDLLIAGRQPGGQVVAILVRWDGHSPTAGPDRIVELEAI